MKQLEIELRNGENLILEVTPLFLEYAEDYEGGIKKLQEDMKVLEEDSKGIRVMNHLLYAIVASNHKEELSYGEAVRLVKIEDIARIVGFINEELPEVSEVASKQNRIKHRR